MLTVYVKTFGCKVNYAESVSLAELLRAERIEAREMTGARLPENPPADSRRIVLVNSCCITAEAERKALQFVRRLRREQPEVDVLLTGCGARHPAISERYAQAGAQVFDYYPAAVDWLKARGGGLPDGPDSGAAAIRARAFIKIQDGCTCRCSFCIIPDVRPYYSRPPGEILAELDRRVAEGYRELVITGVNAGHYGRAPFRSEGAAAGPEKPVAATKYHLSDLIDEILSRLPDGFRLRLSSVEPEDVNEQLLAQLAHPRMCPHLHMPLQSGSDAVLKAMRRRYNVAHYLKTAQSFREACPPGALTTDVLVGYPTETAADFAATMELCGTVGFERIHGFPYSPRPGTPAAQLAPLPRSEVRRRNRELIAHCAGIADRRWQRFIGRRCTVVVEESADGQLTGHGEAYQIVRIPRAEPGIRPTGQAVIGLCLAVKLVDYADGAFSGEIVT